MKRLDELEQRSVFILREARAKFGNLAVMWSTGKDSSTALWLCRKAFMGRVPFPVIHIDTGYKFPEIYTFRDTMAKKWDLDLVVARNDRAIKNGISPEKGRFECCHALKTETLREVIDGNGFDGIIVSIRRDEHGIRAKERVFSPRDKRAQWDYRHQPPEMWSIYLKDSTSAHHTRIHPLLDWTELDMWLYLRKEKVPVNPLYFAKKNKRYRSLGCLPCTVPVDSNARTVDGIIEELRKTKISERSGRSQDKEREYTMQKLRSLGYL